MSTQDEPETYNLEIFTIAELLGHRTIKAGQEFGEST